MHSIEPMKPFTMHIEPSRTVKGIDFDWEHEIQVALPGSYFHGDEYYPVLWVTDGSLFFELSYGILHLLSISGFPEFIVVGVGNPRNSPVEEHSRRRIFDFSPATDPNWPGPGREERAERGLNHLTGGGAPQFLHLLTDELRPTLNREYRMSGAHYLFGSSAGGAFVMYVVLTRPESFSNYICGSPALNISNRVLFKLEEDRAVMHEDLDVGLFLAAGDEEVAEMAESDIVGSMARMAQTLHLRKYPSLRLSCRVFPGETHVTAPAVVLSHGIRTLWRQSQLHVSRDSA